MSCQSRSKKVFNAPIMDHWWQTESGWAIMNHHVGLGLPTEFVFGSCGKPSPGLDVQVLDEERNRCASGELGRVFVKLPLPPGSMSTLWGAQDRHQQLLQRA